MKAILESKQVIQHTYNSCQGVLSLCNRYGRERAEAACGMLLEEGGASYRSLKRILENNRDRAGDQGQADKPYIPSHDNVRGPDAYQ